MATKFRMISAKCCASYAAYRVSMLLNKCCLINTPTNVYVYIYIYYLRNLKFTLKHLKRSYMFRSYDHPQGAYIVPC